MTCLDMTCLDMTCPSLESRALETPLAAHVEMPALDYQLDYQPVNGYLPPCIEIRKYADSKHWISPGFESGDTSRGVSAFLDFHS